MQRGASIPFGNVAGSSTFANLPASPTEGQRWLVTDIGRCGSIWCYDAGTTTWYPEAPTKVFERTTTALADGLVQAAAQVIVTASIGANVLNGKVFRVVTTAARSGVTDTMTPVLRLGAAGTTADATIATLSTLTGGSARSLGAESWFRMDSATSIIRLGGPAGVSFGGSSSLVANAATTVDAVTSACVLSFGCTMSGATDTPQYGYLAIEIQP